MSTVYPGTPLRQGSSGPNVLLMQQRLNISGSAYTAINTLAEDSSFGTNTASAVRRFQKQFGLTPDGVIGSNTWHTILTVSDNVSVKTPNMVSTRYPGSTVQFGSSGDDVRFIQSYMNRIGEVNRDGFPYVTVDGQFGAQTRQLVVAYQTKYGLTADGKVDSKTWKSMITQFNAAV